MFAKIKKIITTYKKTSVALLFLFVLLISLAFTVLLPQRYLLQNGSFENTGSTWLNPWTFGVKTGAAATINRDTSTFTDGVASARVDVTQSSRDYYVQLIQNTSITAGTTYTLSFDAKASTALPITANILQNYSPYTNYNNQAFNVTTSWQHYTWSFTLGTTDANVMLVFNLGSTVGSIWLDNVVLTRGK